MIFIHTQASAFAVAAAADGLFVESFFKLSC